MEPGKSILFYFLHIFPLKSNFNTKARPNIVLEFYYDKLRNFLS